MFQVVCSCFSQLYDDVILQDFSNVMIIFRVKNLESVENS